MWSPFRIIQFLVLLAIFCSVALAQNVDDSRPGNPFKIDSEKDQGPRSIRETLEKMRIDKDKKDFSEMLDHGDEVLKITTQLEKSVEHDGKLSTDDIARLARVEKLAKKIREELGGSNDNEDDDSAGMPSVTDAVKTLQSSTVALYDELKKTTRFTISATAIQSTNMVLRLTRLLKITK